MSLRPWRGVEGLPREAWILFATNLVNRLGTMALPFLVLYLTRHLGLSAGVAGGLLALYGATSLVAAPLSGWVADRLGGLAILRFSLLSTGVVMLVYPLARTVWQAAAMTVLWAATNELYRPASLALVSELVPPEKLRAAFSLNRLAINLGMSLGPALGGFLATVSFPALFVVDGATSLGAGLILLAVPWRSEAGRATVARAVDAPRSTPLLRDPSLLFFLAALFPVALVFFQHEGAMPLFLVKDLGLSEAMYGALFTVNTLLIVFVEVWLNTATAGWSHRRTLALAALLFGVGFGALAFVRGLLGVAATVVVWTFGEMMLFPGMSAYVAAISPEDRRGEAMGLYTMTFNLASAAGPWAGTLLYDRHGAGALWGATFALGALSAAMMLRLREPAPKSGEAPPRTDEA